MALCYQFNIDAYPTVLLISKDGIYQYEEQRSVEGIEKFLDGDYKNQHRLTINDISISGIVRQFIHRIGWITIICGVLMATWLAYICSGWFLKGNDEENRVPPKTEEKLKVAEK